MRWRTVALRALAPITAVVFALLVASVALVLVDRNPLTAFVEMAKFAATLKSFISIMNRAYPLYISAIAVAIGFKMGLFNIGVEGQYLFASLLAAWVAASIALPGPLHVLVVLLVAIVVGSAWSGIAGVLKVTRGVHEVISTIMLNFIAFGLVSWLLANFLRQENQPGDLIIKTAEIPASGRFPSLNPLLAAIGLEPPRGSTWQGFLVVAVLLGIGYYLLVWRTRFGYELRASGINPGAARAAGVDPNAMVVKTMLLSGAFAGLVAIGPLSASSTATPSTSRVSSDSSGSGSPCWDATTRWGCSSGRCCGGSWTGPPRSSTSTTSPGRSCRSCRGSSSWRWSSPTRW